jgi:hypothetical protein
LFNRPVSKECVCLSTSTLLFSILQTSQFFVGVVWRQFVSTLT